MTPPKDWTIEQSKAERQQTMPTATDPFEGMKEADREQKLRTFDQISSAIIKRSAMDNPQSEYAVAGKPITLIPIEALLGMLRGMYEQAVK
jgi:hypothetical protein